MEFTISITLPTFPDVLYKTWMDSEGHSAMTGGKATIQDKEGTKFSAWDGYIEGKNLELEPGVRIYQTWRTSEFKSEEKDSRVEITLKRIGDETELTLKHTELPPHGEQYKKGWEDHYFIPMKEYFG